ncbi:MAG: DNA mismatch endonuclease Vsr [Bacteroidota bacterium]
MDIYSSRKRSFIMSKISGKETKPEIKVRKYLFALGFRYRKNVSTLPGKPDIVLPKYKTVIFINGCFWHGHDCKAAKLPTTRTEFWSDKISANRERDNRTYQTLEAIGWKILVVWQCAIRNKQLFEAEMERVVLFLKQ